MKVIHSNFAISTFAYIILSVFLSFFRDKGSHNRRKGFWIFLRLRAVSPSRRSPSCKSKKFKNIKKKLISACRGELWERLLFYLRDGLRRKEGLLMAKKFLVIIWPYFVSPTQQKNKIRTLRQPKGHPLFFWFEIKLALQTRSLLKPKWMICTPQTNKQTIKQKKKKKTRKTTIITLKKTKARLNKTWFIGFFRNRNDVITTRKRKIALLLVTWKKMVKSFGIFL